MPGRATTLYAAKHAGQRAGLSWSDHRDGGAGEPAGSNVSPGRHATNVDELDEAAASANPLDLCAIAEPDNRLATLYELVPGIEVRSAGHANAPGRERPLLMNG